MLKSLTVRDFGIIECLEWRPSAGLNVLTGETGAGKSLVLDAIDVLLGRRAGQEIVRSGASSAVVEAEIVFSAEGEGAPGRVVGIRREVERSGRGNAYVDGKAVPLRVLKEIGGSSFDLHGPTQQFSLLDPNEQLLLVDAFAGADAVRLEFAAVAEKFAETRKRLQSAVTDRRDLERRRDTLSFEAGEIRAAAPGVGEDDELEAESNLLGNMERLRSAVSAACELIYSGEQGMPSGCDRVAEGLTQLREAAAIDRRLDSGLQAVESALLQLEDAARDLATYRDGLEYDAARHELVQARLDLLRRLKKKYGGSIESVLQHALEAEQELASLDSGEEQRGHLAAELEVLRGRLSELGERLSAQRREAADALSSIVERELAELNMGGTGFMVSFALVEADDELTLADGTKCGFTRMGIDDVEFLIRPNPGEPFMPLSRIASTGETSRLMLALRCALTREGEIPTLIFDEIDMGIGGRSGEVIGRKLARLARRHQVLCVTHLPQVAAFGDSHYRVQKRVAGARTFVELSLLEGVDRERELSDMLGSLGEPSMFGAQELLQRARTLKASAA